MKKVFLMLGLMFLSSITNAQKDTCTNPEEDVLEDLGTITKCSIEPSKKSNEKKSKQIKVRVSASRKRFLKKRIDRKKGTDANALSSSGVSALRAVVKPKALTRTMSINELKKAKKFIELDEVPAFDKCKTLTGDSRVDCFNIEMVNHVNKYFYYPFDAVKDKIEGKIWVRFVIDNQGHISNIKTMGDSNTADLKFAAEQVVAKLPTFAPGIKDGKPVSVKYGFPIDFSLQE